MKKLFLIPMSVCWLYYVSITVVLILILLSILGSVFVPNNVLINLLGFLATLGDSGFVGLIVLITIVGQYFLAYRLYLYFKTKASQPDLTGWECQTIYQKGGLGSLNSAKVYQKVYQGKLNYYEHKKTPVKTEA